MYLPLSRKINVIPCHFMKTGPIGLVLVGGANVNIGAFRRRRLEGRRSNIYIKSTAAQTRQALFPLFSALAPSEPAGGSTGGSWVLIE